MVWWRRVSPCRPCEHQALPGQVEPGDRQATGRAPVSLTPCRWFYCTLFALEGTGSERQEVSDRTWPAWTAVCPIGGGFGGLRGASVSATRWRSFKNEPARLFLIMLLICLFTFELDAKEFTELKNVLFWRLICNQIYFLFLLAAVAMVSWVLYRPL